MKQVCRSIAIGLCCAGFATSQTQTTGAQEPVIEVDGQAFYSWQEYTSSHLFQIKNLRCSIPAIDPIDAGSRQPPSDCSYFSTTITSEYEPTTLIEIPVVVHVITSGATGNVSDALIQSQIDIINEDFRAIAGSNGANGTDTMIQFYLATEDPNGNPTNGITRTSNGTWFNDNGSYWNSLAWDTNRYCNVYTNTASGALGYVPDLPQGGIAGSNSDRVVVLWSAFGNNAPIGPPFNKGRTLTHELGHYFGLYHTFQDGCSGGNCYSNGDRICDTNSESSPNFGCGSPSSCGSSDPVDNYMDYSDDLCMEMFTPEQTNRMRCSIQHYRPDLAQPEVRCETDASATFRNAGNPITLTVPTPVQGNTINATVGLLTTGHNAATILGYATPATTTLPGGQVVLLNLGDAMGELLGLPLQSAPVTAVFPLPVPTDISTCGFSLTMQGVMIGGVRPFALSNAYDVVVGN